MSSVTLARQVPQLTAWLPHFPKTADVVPRPTVTGLQISAPPAIAAGDTVTVTVVATDVEPVNPTTVADAPLQLFLLNTNGVSVLAGSLRGGIAQFVLDEPLTQVAGTVTLQANAGNVQTTTTMTIAPGPPVEPVLALVGPRSILADGQHWAMLTVLPHDRFGNAVADETPVTVRTLHPATSLGDATALSTEIATSVTKTKHLFAWARIHSRTKAGRMYIAANVGAAHSPERTVLAVPGPPAPFALRAEPVQLTADGRRLVTVNTEPLTDAHQNPLLDGTAVTFLVSDHAGGARRLPAQVIDGKATVQLQAPTRPGPLVVSALLLNMTSQPLTLDFGAGIGVEPIDVRLVESDDLYTIIAGPLLGPLGQYIPDGSEVDFAFQRTDSDTTVQSIVVHRITAPAEAGFAAAVVRKGTLPPGQYRVLVTAGVGTGEMTIEHR